MSEQSGSGGEDIEGSVDSEHENAIVGNDDASSDHGIEEEAVPKPKNESKITIEQVFFIIKVLLYFFFLYRMKRTKVLPLTCFAMRTTLLAIPSGTSFPSVRMWSSAAIVSPTLLKTR